MPANWKLSAEGQEGPLNVPTFGCPNWNSGVQIEQFDIFLEALQ